MGKRAMDRVYSSRDGAMSRIHPLSQLKDHDREQAMKNKAAEGDTEADGDAIMEDAEETPAEVIGSKVIVVYMGSQNLRIGLASDALPKTLPMVIARKSKTNESEDHEDGLELEKEFGPETLRLVLLTTHSHVKDSDIE